MRGGRDGQDEPDERDGADWLLGELAGEDADEPAASPPADPQASPPEPDDLSTPEPAAWSSRRERRDEGEGDDWFSIAPAPRSASDGPVIGSTADRPAFAGADDGAGAGAGEGAAATPREGEHAGVPGPVTPTAPFALTWGDQVREADTPAAPFAPPRAARRSFTPPFDDAESAGAPLGGVDGAGASGEAAAAAPPSPAVPSAAATDGEPAPVGLSELTEPAPADAPRPAVPPSVQPVVEPAEPSGAQPVDDYGAALWSALTEPDGPVTPAEPAAAPGASRDGVAPAVPAAASAGAGVFGVPGDAAETGAGAEASEPVPGEPGMQRPRPPFPAFARARWGEPAHPPEGEPVEDLLGEPAEGVPGGPAPRAEAASGVDASHADDPDRDEVEDTGPQGGFVWNLTPDPNAADPRVADDHSRRGARAPEPEPIVAAPVEAAPLQPEPVQPEPVQPPAPEPVGAEPVEPEPVETEATQEPAAPAPAPAATPTAVVPTAAPRPEASAAPGAPATQRTVAMTAAGAPSAARGARPSVAPGGGAGSGGGGPRRPGTGGSRRRTRTLLWIGGGLVVALVLAGLYLLGTQLAGGGEAETPVATPEPTAEPTPTPEPTGPQPAGVHAWDTLFGGECLDGFTSPWAEEFTVVDCAAPHAAQLVLRGELPEDAAAPFPGEAEIGSRMNLLCTAPGVIEVGAASGVNDLQVQGSYPVTEEQWAEGERTYYCFVNRAGGEPLTGSLQGPGPAA